MPISGASKSISTSRWKPECGSELAPAIAFLHDDRLENLDDIAARRGSSLRPTSSIASTKAAELPSMIGTSLLSISIRQLSTRETAQGGEKMLDRPDRDAVLVADHSAERQVLDVLDDGGISATDAAALGDQKAKPSVGCCWMQNNRNWRSAVHPRPCHLDFARDRRLSRADKSIRHMRRPSMPCRATSAVPRAASHPQTMFASQMRSSPLTCLGRRFVLRTFLCRDLAKTVVNNQTIR